MAQIHGLPANLQLTVPTAAAAEQLLKLSATAGWNQTADDWRLLLSLAGRQALSVWHGAQPNQQPVASALALPYSARLAWLGMVLVMPEWRGQGIASALVAELIEQLQRRRFVVGLDATAAGQPVYQRQGFNSVYSLTRLRADAVKLPADLGNGLSVTPLAAEQMAALAAWDEAIFGVNRYPVLAALRQRLPNCAWLVRDAASEDILGYVLGRDGRTAYQLGPIVAVTAAAAQVLLAAALTALDGPVLLDVPDQQQRWREEYLAGLGFAAQRGFARMLLKQSVPLDKPAQIYAVAGPELG